MTQEEMLPGFVELSVILTGYSAKDIADPAINQHRILLDCLVNKVDNRSVVKVLNKVQQLKDDGVSSQEIGEEMVNGGGARDATSRGIVAAIMSMWFLGVWYELDGSGSDVINSIAYQHALVWRNMGAPASGTSRQDYGYWANPPMLELEGTE